MSGSPTLSDVAIAALQALNVVWQREWANTLIQRVSAAPESSEQCFSSLCFVCIYIKFVSLPQTFRNL